MSIKVLGIILAGGLGRRLSPLTQQRAKPSVPFGGKYRIIDFVLSNFINSEIYSIYVLMQFKCQSLMEHLRDGWTIGSAVSDFFIMPAPAQMRTDEDCYRGTADAVYQNLHLIEKIYPEVVAIFNADHIYRMDIRQMLQYHREKEAEVTVAAIPLPIEESHPFGVIQVDDNWRIIGYEEKPENPHPIPGRPDMALVSMGNYLFNTTVLCETLKKDVESSGKYDLAGEIIPILFQKRRVFAYDFRINRIPGALNNGENIYWRDIGTIKAYYEANMDLTTPVPSFNLYNRRWPLRTATYATPPVKLIYDQYGREAMVRDSLIAGGTIISGGEIRNSIMGRHVFVGSRCVVEDSIIFDHVTLMEDVRIKRTIVDKNVTLPPGTRIGYDMEQDRRRYFVDPSGIVVVPKAEI
ncbi:MAG: glucose-1-phosphate adenylyltransferase [Deltaproteobacteria bacterium]|nr:glucose-1-phosphate adenylyltransferase [Deltaproteobacteria bacterium]